MVYLLTVLTCVTVLNSWMIFKTNKANYTCKASQHDLKTVVDNALAHFEKELSKKANKYYKNGKAKSTSTNGRKPTKKS